MVLGVCRMLLRDLAEAEDASQQAFLSAYRSLLAGNRPQHPAAWLATIARNECWARIQQRMREPVAEAVSEQLVSTLPGPVEAAARRADLSALVAAIGALPAQQRDALLLREFSGLTYAELAATLSVSEPAVESLLVRARRELRVRLQPAYAASVAPFVLLRDWLGRLGPGAEPALGTAAKLSAIPLAAKLAAGAVTVAVVGGVTVGGDGFLHGVSASKAGAAAAIGVSDAAAGTSRQGTAGAAMPVRQQGAGAGGEDPAGRSGEQPSGRDLVQVSEPSPAAGKAQAPSGRGSGSDDVGDRGDGSGGESQPPSPGPGSGGGDRGKGASGDAGQPGDDAEELDAGGEGSGREGSATGGSGDRGGDDDEPSDDRSGPGDGDNSDAGVDEPDEPDDSTSDVGERSGPDEPDEPEEPED